MKKNISPLFILICSLWGPPCDSHAELIITPVAVSGQFAPVTMVGVTFSGNFTDVQINDSGQVLFIANLSGPGVNNTNKSGIWLGLPGSLQAIVRLGEAAPKSDGAPFTFIFKPVLSDSGAVMFFAHTTPRGATLQSRSTSSDLGSTFVSWVESARRFIDKLADQFLFERPIDGRVKLIFCRDPKYVEYHLSDDSPVGDLIEAGRSLQRFSLEKIQVKGVVSKASQNEALEPPQSALLISDTNGVAGLIMVGDVAPGATNEFLSLDQAGLAGDKVAFVATTSNSKSGIWSGTSTNLQPIVFRDAPMPPSLAAEFGAGARWGGLSGAGYLGMNAKGEVAFSAFIFRASDYLGAYLFAGPPGAPRVAARFVPFPSTEEGFVGAGNIVMNSAGDVAFTSFYTSPREVPGFGAIPEAGLYGLGLTYQHGPPKLMLAQGKTAPGLKDGEVISFFGFGGGPFMNRHGQVVMHAEIGSAVGFEHRADQGIWLIDPVRGPQLVVRGGTLVDIGGGQMRQITEFSVSFLSTHDENRNGGEDGRPKPFNDLGQVVFTARWQENGASRQGVFVAGEVRVLAGRKIGDDIQVSFATAPGRKYRIRFRDAVESGAWATLQENVDGTGGAVIVTDPGAARLPKRFYRVGVLP